MKEKEQQTPSKILAKLDLMAELGKVKSPIKEEITSDFVYSKLGEQDKKLTIEAVQSAYYIKKVLDKMKKSKVWQWKDTHWQKEHMEETTQKKIEKMAERCFSFFMIRPYMINILNRNVKDNWLVMYTMNIPEEDKQEEPETEGVKGILKNILKAREEK